MGASSNYQHLAICRLLTQAVGAEENRQPVEGRENLVTVNPPGHAPPPRLVCRPSQPGPLVWSACHTWEETPGMSRVARVAGNADNKMGPVGRFKHTGTQKPHRHYLRGASLEQRASFLLPDLLLLPGGPWASRSPLCASVSSSLIQEPWLFWNCGRNP